MELENLKDEELLERLGGLARKEREDTAAVVEHLAEVDRRDLAVGRGFSSLFDYCVRALGYSEPSAYHRIRAARAIKRMPKLLGLLREGELCLESLVLLHPHLETPEADNLVEQARGKSKREVEAALAPLSPRPVVRDSVRLVYVKTPEADGLPLFERHGLEHDTTPIPPTPRSEISFGAEPAFLALIGRAKSLLWHKFPDGRLEDIFGEALRNLLERKDPGRWGATIRGGVSSNRTIPRRIRRMVWTRDGGRCAFTAAEGARCPSRTGLEFDHIRPWSRGGSSNDPGNIRLLCRAHNQWTARLQGFKRPNEND